ncbi:MAG: hypothetical protein HY020_10795 [Burkholderiales bacterium]|nr:hypothetical protein [Burkholderiales bacterium]
MANLIFNQAFAFQAKTQELLIETDVNAAQRANIVRDGKPVAQILVNQDKISGVLVGYRPLVSRVVTQSIVPGTPVSRGTAINLVLAEATRIPLSVVDGIYAALQQETMASLYTRFLADDAELKNIVANAAIGAPTPAADVATVQRKAAAKGVQVTDTAGQDFAAFMTGLQAAYTFNG